MYFRAYLLANAPSDCLWIRATEEIRVPKYRSCVLASCHLDNALEQLTQHSHPELCGGGPSSYSAEHWFYR